MTKKFNKLRQKRKIAVYNAYYDKDLANKARSWSDERILKELGITVPKHQPKLRKQPSQKTVELKQKELEHYRYGVLVAGLEYKKAYQLKRYSKPRLVTSGEYYKQLKLGIKEFYTPENEKKRIELWKQWSKDEILPPDVVSSAYKINKNTMIEHGKRRLDVKNHYGFAVNFYMFVYGRDQSQVQRALKPDQWNPEIYHG